MVSNIITPWIGWLVTDKKKKPIMLSSSFPILKFSHTTRREQDDGLLTVLAGYSSFSNSKFKLTFESKIFESDSVLESESSTFPTSSQATRRRWRVSRVQPCLKFLNYPLSQSLNVWQTVGIFVAVLKKLFKSYCLIMRIWR